MLPQRADLGHIANDAFFQQGRQEHGHSPLGCRAGRLTHTRAHLNTNRKSDPCLRANLRSKTNNWLSSGRMPLPYWASSGSGLQLSSQIPETGRDKILLSTLKGSLCCVFNITSLRIFRRARLARWYKVLTFMSSRTLNSVSQISAR